MAFSAIVSSVVMAGGYKIPEQSLSSMTLGAAYVAHTTGADTAYFNPANMSFMDTDKSHVEGGLTLVHLPSIAPGVDDSISQGGFSEGGAFLATVGIAYEH